MFLRNRSFLVSATRHYLEQILMTPSGPALPQGTIPCAARPADQSGLLVWHVETQSSLACRLWTASFFIFVVRDQFHVHLATGFVEIRAGHRKQIGCPFLHAGFARMTAQGRIIGLPALVHGNVCFQQFQIRLRTDGNRRPHVLQRNGLSIFAVKHV